MVELEEEGGCYTTKNEEAHMYHHSVMPCSWQIREGSHALFFVVHTIVHPPLFVVHAPLWVVHAPLIEGRIFLWAALCVLQGHELLRLGARYWLGAPNDWNTTGHPQVLGRSVGEPVNPIFIGSTRQFNLHPRFW